MRGTIGTSCPILDRDLAGLYGVAAKVMNQAVRRNIERFPSDFMFQLTVKEAALLRSQTVTLETGRGRHRKYLPYAFTEHGVAMLSSVLRSRRAVQVNIEIVRVFVRLRHVMAANSDLARRLADLEKRHDAKFRVVFEAIRQLMTPPRPKPGRIGFRREET
ncbi:MAG TPA: ORF6N domain-containing protein [Planctomycetota bacterium]